MTEIADTKKGTNSHLGYTGFFGGYLFFWGGFFGVQVKLQEKFWRIGQIAG